MKVIWVWSLLGPAVGLGWINRFLATCTSSFLNTSNSYFKVIHKLKQVNDVHYKSRMQEFHVKILRVYRIHRCLPLEFYQAFLKY
jgi:hypothetical protein